MRGAVTGELPKEAWLVFIGSMFWIVAYDTMYAMVDRDDDLKIGVKSTAILFGRHDRLMIGIIQVAMLAVLLQVGFLFEMGALYYSGVAAAAGFSVYHQYLIRDRDRGLCFKAFLNNNWLGAAVFAGIVADYLVRT